LNTRPTSSRPARPWHALWRWRLVIAAFLMAIGYGAWRQVVPPPAPKPPPSGIVSRADVQQVVQAAGILQAQTRVDVGAQVSGQIKALHVQLGQRVRKGDLLVSLDPELAQADVTQAEAALAQQRALLESRQVDITAARREVERQKRLAAAGAAAAQELERTTDELAKLEADAKGQNATLQRLQAELTRTQLRLGYTRITAPMDGVVVSLPVQVGQTVIAIQITPVMLTLADLDTITVRTRVPEADIQSIRTGQVARFSTLSGEARRYEGKVRVIQPIPERAGNAVFYNVLFEVENRDRRLYSDMTVQVDIETGRVRDVPTVPMVALGERGSDGRYRVIVLDDQGRRSVRQVRTGLQDGTRVEVLEGLKPGEKVLLAPPSAADAASAAASAASAASAGGAASAASAPASGAR
jgi:macrolide-specific efflux system membrane fusion protein